jgi:uncharacterized protein YbaP (TraB family)
MRQFRFIYLLLSLLLLHPVIGQAQKPKKRPAEKTAALAKPLAKSLLWEITGNGLKQPSYLYGTYHLLNDSYLNSEPAVKQSFQQSKGVVIETEIDSSAMMQMASKMIMPDNKISALLPPEEYALVEKEVKQALGYDMAMLDQMKPMTLLLMLSVLEYQKMEVLKQYQGKPLDVYFAQQGRTDGKKITSLETMEQQLDLLYSHYPVEKQAKQLVEYVKQKETALQLQDHLTKLYFEEDLAGMWAASEAYNKLMGEEDMAYMVDNRNKNWMTQLPEIMKQQPTFIAVGAMHLPGENGLLQLLQKAGYKVKPIQ